MLIKMKKFLFSDSPNFQVEMSDELDLQRKPCAVLVGKAGPEPDYRHNSGKNQVDIAADIHGHTHGASRPDMSQLESQAKVVVLKLSMRTLAQARPHDPLIS